MTHSIPIYAPPSERIAAEVAAGAFTVETHLPE